jgi:hypothetical protein
MTDKMSIKIFQEPTRRDLEIAIVKLSTVLCKNIFIKVSAVDSSQILGMSKDRAENVMCILVNHDVLLKSSSSRGKGRVRAYKLTGKPLPKTLPPDFSMDVSESGTVRIVAVVPLSVAKKILKVIRGY